MNGLTMKPPGKVVTEAESSINCSVCGKEFQDYSNCRKHALRHGQMKGNECEICHKLFRGRQQKLQHVMFEHGKGSYEFKCEICSSIFQSVDELHEHTTEFHGLGQQCSICYEMVSGKQAMEVHMQEHIENRSAFKCDVCDKYYKDRYNLNIHKRIHTGEKPFDCPHCDQSFMRRMTLFRHIEMKHTSEMPFHCALCDVSFKTILQLRSHVKRKVHQQNQNVGNPKKSVEKNYACKFCSKTFSQQTYLTLHMRIHTHDKKYYCPVCKRGFVQVGNMHQHIKRMHQPKIPNHTAKKEIFLCQICGHNCSNKRSLKYHMNLHKTERKLACKHCEKVFENEEKLRIHERFHQDSSLQCQLCLKGFFSNGNLKRHQNTSCPMKLEKKEPMDDAVENVTDSELVDMNVALSCVMKMEDNLDRKELGIAEEEVVSTDCLESKLQLVETEDGNFVLQNEKNEVILGNDNLTNHSFNIQVISEEEIKTIEEKGDIIEDALYECENDDVSDNENDLLLNSVTSSSFGVNEIQESAAIDVDDINLSVHTSECQVAPSDQNETTIVQLNKENLRNFPTSSKSDLSLENDSSIEGLLSPAIQSGNTTVDRNAYQATDPIVKTEPQDKQEFSKLFYQIVHQNDESKVIIYKMNNKIVEIRYIVGEENSCELEEEMTLSIINKLKNENMSECPDNDSLCDNNNLVFNEEMEEHTDTPEENLSLEFVPKTIQPRKKSNIKSFCKFCNKAFSDKSNLRQHEKRHNQNKSNECSVCHRLFQGRRQVFQHKLLDHGIKPTYLNCKICDKAVTSLQELRLHQTQVHIDEYPFECSHCFKRYQDKDAFDLHVRFHTKPHKCTLCDKSYSSSHLLSVHQLTHSGIKDFQCDVCGMSFATSNQLRSHRRTHIEEKPYCCTICGKGFKRSKDQLNHEISCDGKKLEIDMKGQKTKKLPAKGLNKIYNCNICSKHFSQRTYLTIHMRTHTGEHPYFCPICGKTFVQNGNMQKHMRSHVNNKRLSDWLKCDKCDDLFRSYTDLSKHTRLNHNPHNQDMLTCKKCYKTFQTERGLQMHMMTHETFKNVECDICHKYFRNTLTLEKHRLTHLTPIVTCSICNVSVRGERVLMLHKKRLHNPDNKFKCETCKCRYPDQSKLDKHRRIHLEKPHVCSICDRSYANPKSLRDHIQMHDAQREFQCSVCHKLFLNSSRLRRHIKIHTRQEELAKSLKQIVEISQVKSEVNDEQLPEKFSSLSNIEQGINNSSMKIIISGDSFECVDCQKEFSDQTLFLEHVKSHRDIENVAV